MSFAIVKKFLFAALTVAALSTAILMIHSLPAAAEFYAW
jgi:hypothetical protein